MISTNTCFEWKENMELFDELNNVSNGFLLETFHLPTYLFMFDVFFWIWATCKAAKSFDPDIFRNQALPWDTRYGVGLDAYVSSTSPKDETWILLLYIYRLYEVGMFRHTYMLVFFSLRMLFIYIYVGVMLISRPYLYIYTYLYIYWPSWSPLIFQCFGRTQSVIYTDTYVCDVSSADGESAVWVVGLLFAKQ